MIKKYIQPLHIYTIHSDGTINVETSNPSNLIQGTVKITDITVSSLLALKIACDKGLYSNFDLYFPYMPFGRQDRSETLTDKQGHVVERYCTLGWFIESIASKVNTIITDDAHSEIYNRFSKTFNNTQLECITNFMFKSKKFSKSLLDINLVVAPDAGAKDKSTEIANKLEVPLLCGTKERDPITKEIKLSNDFDREAIEGKVIGIFDDIMDYGTSVRDLAKQLKDLGAKEVVVYITNGLCPLNKRIDPPSRFKFVLEYVDQLFFYNLKDTNLMFTHQENVTYLNSI